MDWLVHFFGMDDGSGMHYLFWSGIGAVLIQPGMLIGALVYWRRHVCHQHLCWRLGKHPVSGSPFVVCARHHPDVPDQVTADHIAAIVTPEETHP